MDPVVLVLRLLPATLTQYIMKREEQKVRFEWCILPDALAGGYQANAMVVCTGAINKAETRV